MTLDHVLLDFRSAIEQAGGNATGIKITVADPDTMLAIQRALGGLMSTPNAKAFMALGFKFKLETHHSGA